MKRTVLFDDIDNNVLADGTVEFVGFALFVTLAVGEHFGWFDWIDFTL